MLANAAAAFDDAPGPLTEIGRGGTPVCSVRLARDPWSARRGADTVAHWLQESRSARENTMFDRFTDRAKEALFSALQEATCRNQRYIGTEHILLGLVREGIGTAANVLRNLNADAERIRRAIDMVIKASPSMPTTGLLPFLLPAKNALAWSVEEACESRHNYIGTEHLLLGLIRDSEGTAALALTSLGVTQDLVREEVLELRSATESSVSAENDHTESAGHSGGFGSDNQPGDDGDASSRLLQRYREFVRARIDSCFRSLFDADHIPQPTFVDSSNRLVRFGMQVEGSFLCWLAKHTERQLHEIADGEDTEKELPPAAHGSIEDALHSERAEEVEKCLERLAEPLRTVIVLRDYDGLEWNEVAAKMGLQTDSTARELHRRALLELAGLLRRRGPGPERA